MSSSLWCGSARSDFSFHSREVRSRLSKYTGCRTTLRQISNDKREFARWRNRRVSTRRFIGIIETCSHPSDGRGSRKAYQTPALASGTVSVLLSITKAVSFQDISLCAQMFVSLEKAAAFVVVGCLRTTHTRTRRI